MPYLLGCSLLDGYQIVFSGFLILSFILVDSYLYSLDPDKESVEQLSGTVAAETVVSGVTDLKNDGTDTYDDDPSFSVGKSPPQNGHPASERASGAGGLGEGTPKVCCLFLYFKD